MQPPQKFPLLLDASIPWSAVGRDLRVAHDQKCARDAYYHICVLPKRAQTAIRKKGMQGFPPTATERRNVSKCMRAVGFEPKEARTDPFFFWKKSAEKKSRNVNLRRFAKKSGADPQANAHSSSVRCPRMISST
jgi:hypothetical protein